MMHACTILAISASLALLASANKNVIDERRAELYKEIMNCCKTTKVLASAFKEGGIVCGGKYLMDKVTNFYSTYFDSSGLKAEFQDGCLVECLFDANGYLHQDKSLIESDFKLKLLAKAEEKDKGLIDTGLTKCFEIVANNPIPAGSPGCKSNSQLLLSCVARHILLNCPKSAWKEYRDNCEGKRTSFVEEVTALDKKAAEAARAEAAKCNG